MAIKTYYALMDAEDLAKDRLQKIDTVRASRRSTDMARRLHRNWLMYYSLNDWKASLSDNLYASGPNGERIELRANHVRNIIQHMHQLTTSTRPTMTPKSSNMDIKSLKQVEVARAIIDHYMDFEDVWRYIDAAVEQALVLHGGFIHAPWDPNRGEPWSTSPAADGNPGQIMYQGDFRFSNPSLFDVVFDQIAYSWDDVHDLVVREWRNKYELMAEHPSQAEEINKQKTKREWEVYDSLPQVFFTSDDSNQVEVHTFYHERTVAVPRGRQTSFLSTGEVLEDGPLQYDKPPVFRIVASETMGTPHGWSPLTDLASLQESINKGLSSIATNQFAFGVQNIWAPRGSRLDVTQLTGGLNLIEGSPVGPNGGKPEVLDLLNTPKELFDFYEIQVKIMETLSGVNQVVRGNPEVGLTAGVALALISTQSLQFMTPLQRSYANATRDLVTHIVNTLKEKATTPRLLHIVGKAQREALMYFTGQDIDGINRVSYELGNPMTMTPAGRMQLAQSVIEAGVPLNPEQILQIIDKGKLDPMFKDTIDQLDNIVLENEDLRDGKPVPVLVGDDDRLHLQEHIAELQNPELRRDMMAQQALVMHINGHVQKYMNGDMIRGIIDGMIPPPYAMPVMPGPSGKPGEPPPKPGEPPAGGSKPGGQHSAGGERKAPPEKKNGAQRLPEPKLQEQNPLPQM